MPAPITAARLADEMDVSLRSLYRDIDSLRAAGARIDGERGYGYRMVEDYALPPQTFDRTEIEAIALGLGEVKRMGDPALAKAAISVLAKVAATLPDEGEQHLFHAISQVYRPDVRYAAPLHMDAVREACWKEEALSIRYADRNSSVTERKILPLACLYRKDADCPCMVLPAGGVSYVPAGTHRWPCIHEHKLPAKARRHAESLYGGTQNAPCQADRSRS
jgi:predicted DNA-binding transcriptional regulator YafY